VAILASEADRERDGVRIRAEPGPLQVLDRGRGLGRERLAAEVAGQQAEQGDPHLHARQEHLRVLGQLQRLARAAAVDRHLLEAGAARGEHGQLRQREEAVRQHQQDNYEDLGHGMGAKLMR